MFLLHLVLASLRGWGTGLSPISPQTAMCGWRRLVPSPEQALKRVTVVGEPSRGGANPSVQLLLSDRFGAIIPQAITRNPVTMTSWDGKGVTPDIPATSETALDVAHLEAARAISAKHRDDSLTGEIEEVISKLGGAVTK